MQISYLTREGGPRPRIILLLTAALMLLVLATAFVAGNEQRARYQAEMDVRLRTVLLQRVGILSRTLEDLRVQLRFLSQTPPVPGLVRADADGGFDAREKTAAALWQRRLESIFAGFSLSRPGVERLALLSVRQAAPIVAVESQEGQTRTTGPEEAKHPDLDLLALLAKRTVDDVLVADLDLARDPDGRITDPARPLLRLGLSVPATDGSRFGAVTLAVDARGLMADLVSDINPIFDVYLLDAQDNFLLHPDPSHGFGVAKGHPRRWEEEFQPLEDGVRRDVGAATFQTANGLMHVMRQRVPLDRGDPGRFLTIAITVPDRVIAGSADNVRLWVAGLGLPLTGLVALLLVLGRLAQRRNREIMSRDAWLGAIVDGASDAIIGLSHDGRVTSWNAAAARMFGRDAGDAIGGKTAALIVPPGLEIQEEELLGRVARGETVANLRTRRQHRDGRTIDVSITATPVRGSDGTTGAALIIRDITEQVAAEAGIRDLNSRLERQVRDRTMEIEALAALRNAILHCAGSAIITCDRSGTITLFNPTAETMLGYAPQEVVGKATPALFHDPAELGARGEAIQADGDHALLSAMDVLAAGARDGGIDTREWSYLRKDGSRLPVLLAVTTLQEKGGGIAGYLIIATDISSQVRDAARLRDALAGAEASSRAKSAFLANMGHEIRTPLNGIIGSAHLVLADPLSDSQRTHVDSIRRSASALLAIINDVLDYSRIDAGLLVLEPAPFRLADPVGAVADLFGPVLRTRQVDLDITIDPSLPDWVLGDAGRVRQILDNLVGNAVKFTPAGTIAIALRRTGARPDGSVEMSVTVSDTGIGMPPEQVARLFQPFTLGDDSHRRRHGGTGLGLALTHRLVQMMDGTIHAESNQGRGSRFIIDLCLTPVDPPASASGPVPPATVASPFDDMSGLDGARILVVEDNELNRFVAKGFLDRAGAVTSIAVNGAEAVAAVERETFDLVLMDLQMPVMDGLEATRAIRDLPAGRDLPILALTAAGHEQDLQSCMDAGMDDHIDKPFVPALFLSTLRRWLSTGLMTVPPTPVSPPPVLARPDPIPGIDMEQAMGRVLGNRALLETILDQFVARFDGLGARLSARLAEGQADMAVRKLHELRGAAGNISALSVAEQATALERALRADPAGNHAAALTTLDAALTMLVAGIRARSRPHPADTVPVTPPPATAPTAAPPDLEDLRATLRTRRLTALDALADRKDDLTRRLGTDKFRELSGLVEALRFDEALAFLEVEFPV
ncbi:PAS domain S-box protein [Niveispirillum sp.]|uniref:PAS domain S-box protein n=1 Tax=Niveispirillum sp. TaxID=1917217 RepID=UPI001B65F2A8|nr:PAS domain S-box protein [Niveispirillum sp.]MBP7338644.1 PAS domain S-box protein [Niveispirillum sp.]